MKKTIPIILALLAAQALMADEAKALLGVRSSKYFFSSEVTSLERRQKTGLAFGLGYAREIAPRLRLEGQVLLGEKGAKAAIAYAPGQELVGTYRCSVLSVPLLLSYRLRDGSSPYFAAGPQLDFILSHTLRFADDDERVDIAEATSKMMVGVTAALGYGIGLKNWGAFIELRFERWLSDLWKSPEAKVGGEAVGLLAGAVYYF